MKTILLQAGHVSPRQLPGVGTAGEQELVHEVQHKLLDLLDGDDRIEGLHYHGDLRNAPKEKGLDLALFLHGDGSVNSSVSGYSFGFPAGRYASINKPFADKIAAEFERIGHPGSRRNDNYTVGLARYYGYRYTPADGAEVLVEHGFLTNPSERNWLFAHTSELALAEYRAIQWELGLDVRGTQVKPEPEPKWPVPVPTWFWVWARWYLGRGEFKGLPPRHNVTRPCDAPHRIPGWAWRRLAELTA